MTAATEREQLITALEEAVQEALRYFEGPGATSTKRIGEWGPREVLGHFIYWHEMSARGMESVAQGGEPPRLDIPSDEANARFAPQYASQSFPELIAQAQQVQQRLVAAAHSLPDLDTVVLVRPDGALTARQRLERTPRHWREHVQALQA